MTNKNFGQIQTSSWWSYRKGRSFINDRGNETDSVSATETFHVNTPIRTTGNKINRTKWRHYEPYWEQLCSMVRKRSKQLLHRFVTNPALARSFFSFFARILHLLHRILLYMVCLWLKVYVACIAALASTGITFWFANSNLSFFSLLGAALQIPVKCLRAIHLERVRSFARRSYSAATAWPICLTFVCGCLSPVTKWPWQ